MTSPEHRLASPMLEAMSPDGGIRSPDRGPAALARWPSGWTIAEATSHRSRGRGLLGRTGLLGREGLWLPVRSVHTFGMRFALDLVWLDRAGGVVRVDADVCRRRVRTCLAARGGVVEVAEGSGAALAAALVAPGRRATPGLADA